MVETKLGYDQTRYLRLRDDNNSRSFNAICFQRIDTAEQNAKKQRQQEQDEFVKQAVAAAVTAKRADRQAVNAATRADPETDQKLYIAFENLRQRAEAETAAVEELRRRPSWAPPLLIEGELFDLCVALGLLTKHDKPAARLWATFADPKKSTSVLRHLISNHELPGIACRGFQLHPGTTRQGTNNVLFEAQGHADGTWQFGPRWHLPLSEPWVWVSLVTQRAHKEYELQTAAEHGPDYVRLSEQSLAQITQQLTVADLRSEREIERYKQRQRVLQLARARVLNFVGTADVQMRAAARLTGQCCICGKTLTDPTSVEAGIGPDCRASKVDFIRSWARDAITAGQTPPLELITLYSGMPRDFVTAVIDEMTTSHQVATGRGTHDER